MNNLLFSNQIAQQSDLPAERLGETIQAFQRDKQTGMLKIDSVNNVSQILFFVRGQIVTVYKLQECLERVNPDRWSLAGNIFTPILSIKILALTPQDVRVIKILIEQNGEAKSQLSCRLDLEKIFAEWMEQTLPALIHVRWKKAEVLVLFPGRGDHPCFTLWMTEEQIKHSAGNLSEICSFPEPYDVLSNYSSAGLSMAWSEYLLFSSFSSLVVSLFVKFEKLMGRMLLNQIIREINFKATAHDWNLNLTANSVNDQTIFSSPEASSEVYTRLLEVIFVHFDATLGHSMLKMLVGDIVGSFPATTQKVLKTYLPITNMD